MDSDDLDFESPSQRKRRERKRRNCLIRRFLGKKKPKRQTKWWVIKESKVKVDERFEDKPLGLGVFTTRRVKETIYFEGGEYICLTRLKLTSRRRDYYAVCSDDKNYVVTPTDLDIERGSLNYCWRINHSTINPTHELEWDNTESQSHPYGRPVLKPLRFVEVDEELTFDYCNK